MRAKEKIKVTAQRCEQDKKNAAFSTRAYYSYASKKKRKFDNILRSIYAL